MWQAGFGTGPVRYDCNHTCCKCERWRSLDVSGAARGLRAVALLELVKGVLVLVAAGVIVGLLNTNLQSLAEDFVRHFHLNPARHHPQVFVETLRNLADAHRILLSIGAVFYAMVRFVEAYGLWRARTWAWGFGILSAGLYIPLELVELWKHITWPGIAVLIANVLVVIVLWYSKTTVR
jgi:uncharacterized membrane protein (DUF2068 family)